MPNVLSASATAAAEAPDDSAVEEEATRATEGSLKGNVAFSLETFRFPMFTEVSKSESTEIEPEPREDIDNQQNHLQAETHKCETCIQWNYWTPHYANH